MRSQLAGCLTCCPEKRNPGHQKGRHSTTRESHPASFFTESFRCFAQPLTRFLFVRDETQNQTDPRRSPAPRKFLVGTARPHVGLSHFPAEAPRRRQRPPRVADPATGSVSGIVVGFTSGPGADPVGARDARPAERLFSIASDRTVIERRTPRYVVSHVIYDTSYVTSLRLFAWLLRLLLIALGYYRCFRLRIDLLDTRGHRARAQSFTEAEKSSIDLAAARAEEGGINLEQEAREEQQEKKWAGLESIWRRLRRCGHTALRPLAHAPALVFGGRPLTLESAPSTPPSLNPCFGSSRISWLVHIGTCYGAQPLKAVRPLPVKIRVEGHLGPRANLAIRICDPNQACAMRQNHQEPGNLEVGLKRMFDSFRLFSPRQREVRTCLDPRFLIVCTLAERIGRDRRALCHPRMTLLRRSAGSGPALGSQRCVLRPVRVRGLDIV